MADMSYISIIERYHEYRGAIHELLASILSGVLEEKLFTDPKFQQKTSINGSMHKRHQDTNILAQIHKGIIVRLR